MNTGTMPAIFSTGSPALDQLLEELRAGDNVVFYTDHPGDYEPFVATMLCHARSAGIGVVYGRASGALDAVMGDGADLHIVEIADLTGSDPAQAFREAAQGFGPTIYYAFDPLPDLQERLGHEAVVRDFFLSVCPFLFDMSTVAYWGLPRGVYRPSTVAAIKDCTQIFVQVSRHQREPGQEAAESGTRSLMITPVKVWGRYSEDMFRPHLVAVAENAVCMQISPLNGTPQDDYTAALADKNRELAEIRDALNRSNAELVERNRELAHLNAEMTEQSRLYESLRNNLEHLLALFQAGQAIGSSLVVEQVRQAILEATLHLFDIPGCRLVTLSGSGRNVGLSSHGRLPRWLEGLEAALIPLRAEVCRQNQVRTALLSELLDGKAADPSGSLALAPIMSRGRCEAVLELYATDGRLHADEARMLLRYLASEASIALDNAHLHRETDLQRGQLRSFVDQVITSEEQESRRFAYDLHDGLVQLIVAAFQHLQTAQALRTRDPADETAEVEQGVRLLRQAIYEARRLISELRPAGLDDFGLLHALRLFVAQLEADHPWEVTLTVDPSWGDLPASLEAALFRIIQEASTNARKYAMTDRLVIALRSTAEEIKVSIQDWGVGFDPEELLATRDQVALPAQGTRIGLIGIRERARLWGGECEVTSQPRAGTRIAITIPRARLLSSAESPWHGQPA
jgi:signal transduction histidine kinase